jgi:FkbM family methyltransferase
MINITHDLDQIFLKNIQNQSLTTQIIDQYDSLVIYGHGQGFHTFYEFVIRKLSLNIDLIVDKKFCGKGKWLGIDTSDVKSVSEKVKKHSIVIITIGSHEVQKEIKNQLLDANFEHIVTAFEFYEYHLSHASCDVINGGEIYYKQNDRKIKSAYSLLQDIESQTVFSNLLELYYTRVIGPIKCRPISEQYVPRDLKFNKGYSHLLNCGAFDGDTIKNIYSVKGKFESIICVEPDLNNFSLLVSYLQEKFSDLSEEILALPVGLSFINSYVNFCIAGTNSNIAAPPCFYKDKNEERTVDSAPTLEASCLIVNLDLVLIKKDITFINMDIEGAELNALKGLVKTIERCKPDLAISVYHEPAHLWEIALFIDSLNLGYKFFLRNYTGYPAETVLYATT